MPTNCWNIDKKMPTHTIGSSPTRGPRTSEIRGGLSLCSDAWISTILLSTSPPTYLTRMSLACSSFCFPTRYRGDSGMFSENMK